MPGPAELDEIAAGEGGDVHASFERDDVVVGAMRDHDRTAQVPQHPFGVLTVDEVVGRLLRDDDHLGRRVEPVGDAVLDLLRGVRLREDLPDEEFEEVAPIVQPVVPVVLRPALVGLELLVPDEARPLDLRRNEPDRRSHHEHPNGAVRMTRREMQPVERAERDAGDHRRLDTGRVEYGGGVVGELDRVIRLRLRRPVGEAVAAPVERQHAKVTREIRDLQLPVP